MKNELNRSAEGYQKSHRRRHLWQRILSVLSAVTIFVTTYAMILPAITMEPSPGIKLNNDFFYENDELIIEFHVEGRAAWKNEDDAPNDLTADKVQLTVTPFQEGSAAYNAYADYVSENIGSEALYKLLAISTAFTYEGANLDMTNCEITAEVTPKASILQPEEQASVQETLFDEADAIGLREYTISKQMGGASVGAEAEQVLAFSAIEGVSLDITEQDTVYLEEGVMTTALATSLSGDTVAFALYSTINPSYTVQYYSHTTVLDDEGDIAINIIDTSGGKLPTNTTNLPTVPAYLNHVGNGQYVMATHLELAPLYREKEYEYVSAPGIPYVDRLMNTGNYALEEVWVLKTGKDPASENTNDWTIYPADVSFTNRESSAGSNRIFITEGAVIRLVYGESTGDYTNAADFYDYDITDGDIHNASGGGYLTSYQDNGTWYAQTYMQGINDFTAASGTVKFAFGNVNTGTGLGSVSWNGNTLNKYNNAALLGCTFGIVEGLNADGTLDFSDGISAPKLFGTVAAKGKTHFTDYSLQFIRYGDTYTLTAVNGTGANNLEHFNNPSFTVNGSTTTYSHIYTNNFWPMDSAYTWGANGHDIVFGSASLRANRKYFQNASTLSSAKNFPISDDGVDHNSYFGMHYDLTFFLTEDYLGPLEYLFYGDDDMWVFLDGQLICDIGGVHSSVGQYVNLWDYINQMSDAEKYSEHTLHFYYTERGASGSTCYMQFTLPSVSSDTPQIETNSLELVKQVNNAETDQKFAFTIELLNANDQPLPDDYSFTLYAVDGVTILNNGIINSDENKVYVGHGEQLVINYLPEGSKFRITETAVDGFHTSYKVNGGTSAEGNIASGVIEGDTKVLFINSTGRQLPSTGGAGWLLYTLPLLIAIVYLCLLPLIYRFAHRRRRR